MQKYWVGYGEDARLVELPAPEDEVFPGVKWGHGESIDTPAYWALRCQNDQNPLHGFCREKGNLVEEIGFCMLGGFGITVELNVAAYERLAAAGVFDLNTEVSETAIRSMLDTPLVVNGRSRKYRFPNQRASRLVAMRKMLSNVEVNKLTELEVSKILEKMNGIGPKTSAWIIRNHFGSDQVAILDIHVIRACKKLGIFPSDVCSPSAPMAQI